MSEAAPAPPPRVVKFVRRALRANPKPGFDDVLARWRAVQRQDVDVAQLHTIYDSELERASQLRAAPDPRHSQIVVLTIGIWILANIVIALGSGMPGYLGCRQPTSGNTGSDCGLQLGLTFLELGGAQFVYGAVAAVIAYRIRAAVGQGILIGMGIVVVLFTVVCFGTTTTA
jgi:hypothetical protein